MVYLEVKVKVTHYKSGKKMNKLQRATFKVRIIKLASLRSTGPPAELAMRFEIGERSVKRLVKEIREEGIELRYSQLMRSYVTKEDYL